MLNELERLTGSLADRYRIQRELGRGGMATVYLATDLKHDRPVALKVLSQELAHFLGAERFLREIALAARLTHPHILPLHDSGQAGEFLYYVMPFVEGESLRDRLKREKQLPLDDALQIAREVADALSYAHSRGVVHRDIKPENILLETGHAVVADFGIARAIDQSGGEQLTGTGIALGTPAYMSPEQAAGSKELDGRSDLYSLGCVLYEMLAGQPPFTGPSVESLVHQHLIAEPPSITVIRPAVPGWVAAALSRSLAKTPADRFNPVAQFAEAIGMRSSVGEISPGSRRPGKNRWWVRAAVGLAVVAVGGWFTWRTLTAANEPLSVPAESPPYTIVAAFDGTAEYDTREAVGRLAFAALGTSGVLAPLPDEQVRRGLAYAGYPDTIQLTSRIATELAVRGSIRSVVLGTVDRIGGGYAVTVRLEDVDSASVLATSRSTASNDDALIAAVNQAMASLGAAISGPRSRLQQRQNRPLVMTPSFEAYRKYAMAMRISSNDIPAARALLHEALSLDPDFAAAWSELALFSQGEGDAAVLMVQEALRRPDRLSEADRFYNEAVLLWVRDEDYTAALNLLDRVVLIEPAHKAWGDRCTALARLALYEEAGECYHSAQTRSPFGRSASGIRTHAGYLISAGRLDEARRVSAELTAPRRYQRYLWLKHALASADWPRAESLATAYLADPTSQEWVHGRSQLTLASVLAARGAVRRADSVLSEASGAHPFGISIARSLLVTVTGLRVPSTRATIDDTLYSRYLWEMVRDLTWGDTTSANRSLQSLLDAGSEIPKRRRSRRYHEEHGRLAHTLGNAHQGDWEQTARGARAQLSSLHGARIHLFSRWLLATAYEALALPDSAVVYLEQATQSSGLHPFEMFSFGIPYSFAHQRLVILYSGMGRVEDARRHWAIFRQTFTDPDPEYAHLIEEARAALEKAERKAG